MKFYIYNSENETEITNLEEECRGCYSNCNTIGNVVPKCKIDLNITRRIGKQESQKGIFFLCCSQTRTTKLFKEKLELLKYTIPSFFKINNLAVKQRTKKNEENFTRIIHNLRKINAQNIQQLYNLVPQSLLTENIDEQISIIQNYILKDPKNSAKMFLRIAKNSANIRSEFIVYDKLYIENPNLSIRAHKIQSIILNVYHPFEQEFNDKKVKVHIKPFTKKISIDYDTIRVALFHIIANSIKYTKPKSILNIDFDDVNDELLVLFNMTSLYIHKDEIPKLFLDKYSGEIARKINSDSTGYGMGIIQKALELNNAELIVIPGDKIQKENGIEYSDNQFIIKFKHKAKEE